MTMTMTMLLLGAGLLLTSTSVGALRYDPSQVDYNLNQNVTATDPLDYWGSWDNHSYHPSPANWRLPIYSLFLDRFVNGDPTNDNANVRPRRAALVRGQSSCA